MKKIYLIDGNSFIYRMFFGLPEFATKDWKVVNAIFWMAKFFVDSLVKQNPDYLLFIKDAKWDNFRHDLYKDYKATRDRMPDNLRTQIWDIEKMIKMMWVDIVEVEWYEADDVIWTFAKKLWEDKNNDIYILTWDKDLYSLITDNVSIYDTMKRKIFNPEKAKEKFWVEPIMIIDYLAIVWDKADNIPWIDWFWPKKAVDLINIIGWIEEIYAFIDNNKLSEIIEKEVKKILLDKFDEENTKKIFWCFKWKTFEKLLNSRDDAFLSKKLATIELDIDLDKNLLIENNNSDWLVEKKFELDDFKFKPEWFLNDDIKEFFKELEFNSLLWDEEEIKVKTWYDLWLKVKLIQNKNDLDVLFTKINNYQKISLDTETTSLNIIDAKLVWISIYLDDKNIYYINRLHFWDFINDIVLKDFLEKLFKLDILIIWHNLKYDLEILELFMKNVWKINNNNYNDKSNWQIQLEL
jgi:DNA polymerase-1